MLRAAILFVFVFYCRDAASHVIKTEEGRLLCWDKVEYTCADNHTCIPRVDKCNDKQDCPDGDDESDCPHVTSFTSSNAYLIELRRKREDYPGGNSSRHKPDYQRSYELVHPTSPVTPIRKDNNAQYRRKRQSRCSNGQWRCRNGECIDSDGKCDGIKNCIDGSDETHALCRKIVCPDHLFRCTYGACVDGYGKCDNVTNCVDNSDELHPDCSVRLPSPPGIFLCGDGSSIPTTQRCDGRADCPTGADETVASCGATRCYSSHLFQCAYGACVDAGSDCDGKLDCADGSDENAELCGRSGGGSSNVGGGSVGGGDTSKPVITAPTMNTQGGMCILPQYPEHGRYTVLSSIPGAGPGSRVPAASLNVACDPGYMLNNNVTAILCLGNSGWSAPMPKCILYCRLNPHRSVTYHCQVPNTQGGTVICPLKVAAGTTVVPSCNTPNYYSRSPAPYMKCIDGQFDYIHICEPGPYIQNLSVDFKKKTAYIVYNNNTGQDKNNKLNINIIKDGVKIKIGVNEETVDIDIDVNNTENANNKADKKKNDDLKKSGI